MLGSRKSDVHNDIQLQNGIWLSVMNNNFTFFISKEDKSIAHYYNVFKTKDGMYLLTYFHLVLCFFKKIQFQACPVLQLGDRFIMFNLYVITLTIKACVRVTSTMLLRSRAGGLHLFRWTMSSTVSKASCAKPTKTFVWRTEVTYSHLVIINRLLLIQLCCYQH